MRTMMRVLSVAIYCWMSMLAFAQNPIQHKKDASDPCVTQSNTMEMNQCALKDYEKADKELNVVYKKLMTHLSVLKKSSDPRVDRNGEIADPYENARSLLVEGQKAWVKFRDNDCKAIYEYYSDGTIRTVVRYTCLLAHTQIRIKQLEKWGDIGAK